MQQIAESSQNNAEKQFKLAKIVHNRQNRDASEMDWQGNLYTTGVCVC